MKKQSFFQKLKLAFLGIIETIQSQKHMQIHLLAAIITILTGLYLSITRIEWMILALTIGTVLMTETINTAIENCVDLYTKDYSKLAKTIKDVASGAVLLSVLTSLIIAYLIFFERIVTLLDKGA